MIWEDNFLKEKPEGVDFFSVLKSGCQWLIIICSLVFFYAMLKKTHREEEEEEKRIAMSKRIEKRSFEQACAENKTNNQIFIIVS